MNFAEKPGPGDTFSSGEEEYFEKRADDPQRALNSEETAALYRGEIPLSEVDAVVKNQTVELGVEQPSVIELEPISDDDDYENEITEEIIRPAEPAPENVIPFPKETGASWLKQTLDRTTKYARSLYGEVVPLPKKAEVKNPEPVKPQMTEEEMNEEIAEGNPVISAWFKNAEKPASVEEAEEVKEVA